MTEVLIFLLGFMVAQCVIKYRVNKLLFQLMKVTQTGDGMWSDGVRYAMGQIRKVL